MTTIEIAVCEALDYFPHGNKSEPVLDQQVKTATDAALVLTEFNTDELKGYDPKDLELVKLPEDNDDELARRSELSRLRGSRPVWLVLFLK